MTAHEVGKPDEAISLDAIFDTLLNLVAERNPDFYEFDSGRLKRLPT